jgi:ATP-dependent RNA helicase SUPV3L1/SUV3
MAKKKRKHFIKLNNKSRALFEGATFEEGVALLDEETLTGLCMALMLEPDSLEHEGLVRTLRRAWSEGDYLLRKQIIQALDTHLSATVSPARTLSQSVVDTIIHLLEAIPHTRSEEELLLEAFAQTRPAKITAEKVQDKLRYLRRTEKIGSLEKVMDGVLTHDDTMRFDHIYRFESAHFDFNKHLLTETEILHMDALLAMDDLEATTTLKEAKHQAILAKEREITALLEYIQRPHPLLGVEQMVEQIRCMPPDVDLSHIPLPLELIEKIVKNINPRLYCIETTEHLVIEKPKTHLLHGVTLHYTLSISYTKSYLYGSIWRGEVLPVMEDLLQINDDLLAHFTLSVQALEDEMTRLAEGIDLPDGKVGAMIAQFVEPQIKLSRTLKIKEKTKRRILYHYHEYLKPLKERRRREVLLAQTIRDFKQLFPLARALKRRIIFHVGPTNSGKTYAAMQALASATTGCYLAPLRLLALEGYEKLRNEGVAVSLITGEEELIDEESTHVSSTIEMLNSTVEVDVCVIDEIQMIDDRDRGWAWANALIGAPAKILYLTGSADALNAITEICDYLGEPLEIREFVRMNPLTLLRRHTSISRIEPQTAIVAFSRREVLALKQQLSERYRVSVVYGNLSPEVRREEARRFREGQSEVLVATDAIAMGLNLPIRSILFARDNKFDGLRRRELLPSEVLQVAGRAGRYGIEEEGYVGALDRATLETIARQFHAPLRDICLPFSVMASLEHVLLIGEILETENLLEILSFFADNMEFDGPFQAANIDAMLEIAEIVGSYQLDLKTRYFLSCAPASISSPYIESVFHRYLRSIEQNQAVIYIPPRDLPDFAQTNEMLLNAEDRVREISLYLWLSFKFPDHFKETEKAIEARTRLNRFIEHSLKRGYFVKTCKKCGKTLDFTYRYSICDGCYTQGKRGEKRYQGRRRR